MKKPADIASNEVKSRVWDEVTKDRSFRESDIPTLRILCTWHAIAEQCMADMDVDGEIHVAYSNAMDDIKALPQIATLKQASAEIRAINKQLSIKDEPVAEKKETVLHVIQGKRKDRVARRTPYRLERRHVDACAAARWRVGTTAGSRRGFDRFWRRVRASAGRRFDGKRPIRGDSDRRKTLPAAFRPALGAMRHSDDRRKALGGQKTGARFYAARPKRLHGKSTGTSC